MLIIVAILTGLIPVASKLFSISASLFWPSNVPCFSQSILECCSPRGGSFEYRHRSPASRRRRRKWNALPEGITGYPIPMGTLESVSVKYGRMSHGNWA
jgi:hypothetical protein